MPRGEELYYEIDFSSIASFIKSNGYSKILLQAPNGLKTLLPIVIEQLENKYLAGYNIEFYVSGTPSYGACDIAVDEAKAVGAQAIVHIGHNMYPHVQTEIEIPVYYVPAYYKHPIDKEFMEYVFSYLEKNSIKKILLVASLQYVKQARQLHLFLEEKGLKVVKGEPKPSVMEDYQVIGCDYSALDVKEYYDAVAVLSSGLFHALGACLYRLGKKTILIDLLRREIMDLSLECRKILAKRLYIVSKIATSGYNLVALTMGTRPGQYRPFLVDYLVREFGRKGVRVVRVVSHLISREVLAAIDNAFNVDFFVVTNCPRLPIDDLSDFYKPVLTPGEAFMVLHGSLEYRFPW